MKRFGDIRDFFKRGPSLEVFNKYLSWLQQHGALCWPWDSFHMLCIYYPPELDPMPLLRRYLDAAAYSPVNALSARTGLAPLAEVVRMGNTRMLRSLLTLGADVHQRVESLFGITDTEAEALPSPPWSLLDYALMFPTPRLLVLTVAEHASRTSAFPLNSVDWVEQFLRNRARLDRVRRILLCRRIQQASPLLNSIGKHMVALVVRLAWGMRYDE
jgi:hypothetical protein